MRLLVSNGGRPFGRYVEELALEGRLALNILDHLRDTPPVLLGREMRPTGQRFKIRPIGSREVPISASRTARQRRGWARLRRLEGPAHPESSLAGQEERPLSKFESVHEA
jgi:hypothetical protein